MIFTALTHRAAARVAAFVMLALLGMVAGVAHAEAPVKLLVEAQQGAKVNLDETGFCAEAQCKPAGGEGSAAPGGYGEFSPNGVAVVPGSGDLYVADAFNQRVQELTASGEFVLMIGREVDATKTSEFDEPGNPHHITEGEEDVCTAASHDQCNAGTSSTNPGGFDQPRCLLSTRGPRICTSRTKDTTGCRSSLQTANSC